MKRLSTYLLAGIALLSVSCSDFLDTTPKDALSPATTWKTETDAESFVVGCYNGLLDPSGAKIYTITREKLLNSQAVKNRYERLDL